MPVRPVSTARGALAEPAAFDEIEDPALRRVLRAYLARPAAGDAAGRRQAQAAAGLPGHRIRARRALPELEVNETVRVWNPDVAALRRYLVDEGLLAREDGLYWRSGGWL